MSKDDHVARHQTARFAAADKKQNKRKGVKNLAVSAARALYYLAGSPPSEKRRRTSRETPEKLRFFPGDTVLPPPSSVLDMVSYIEEGPRQKWTARVRSSKRNNGAYEENKVNQVPQDAKRPIRDPDHVRADKRCPKKAARTIPFSPYLRWNGGGGGGGGRGA